MASREFAEQSGLNWWRPMGRVVLRGRARPVELYEPAPDFPAEDREALRAAIELSDSNMAAAAHEIEIIITKHPADKSLQNLLKRILKQGKESAYVLG